MKRTSRLVIGMAFGTCLTTMTQAFTPAVAARSDSSQHQTANGVPSVEDQMRLLTPRLSLTSDQQTKFRTMLQNLHDATVKLVEDTSLSQEQRTEQIHAWRWKTDSRMREVLTEDQKKKLDQVEQEPHPELHGNVQ